MKIIITLLIAVFFTFSGIAQTTVDVITGASYANDAYYSFNDGTVSTSSRYNWELAFATNRYNISIMANNGGMVELYTYPDGDTSAWHTVDISNIGSWPQMYNSIENWYDGAFLQNIVEDDMFDYGWGRYSMTNHHIVGDSLYVIKTAAGAYKKLWIIEKNPNMGVNSWSFRYADIDGSNEQTVLLEADPYTAKNYVHYSITSNQIVDKEPDNIMWDLLFTKYYDYNIPYYVTGVLANSPRVTVQEVDGVDQATYEEYDEDSFTNMISTIGSDWKEFNMSTMEYEIDDDRVYFVKVLENDGTDSTYWKMYFTAFTGTSEGKYTFVQKKLLSTVFVDENNEDNALTIYPNPATNQLNLIADVNGTMEIVVSDITGNIVIKQLVVNNGFDKQIINIDNLAGGIYVVSASHKGKIIQSKFVKQ